MNIFAVALAENASVSSQQAAAAATTIALFGMSMGILMVFGVIWFILQVIADWKIFEKAGEPGWKSIIPFYNVIVEYGICWNSFCGLLFIALPIISGFIKTGEGMPAWHGIVVTVLGVVTCLLHFIQSVKLSKAFGKGTGFGILLFIFGPICRLVLGFGSAEYVGRR